MHTRLISNSLCSCDWPWTPDLPALASQISRSALSFVSAPTTMQSRQASQCHGGCYMYIKAAFDLSLLFSIEESSGNSDNSESLNESFRDKWRFIMKKGWEFEKKCLNKNHKDECLFHNGLMGRTHTAVLFLLSYSGSFVCLAVNSLVHAPPLLFPYSLLHIFLSTLSEE